jgi:hypothetical protein
MSFLLIAGREAAEEPLSIRIKSDQDPRGNVTCVARYQRLDVTLSELLPLKGGSWQLMRGVIRDSICICQALLVLEKTQKCEGYMIS